jgi:intracellular multiplication protein IcmE
MAGKKENIKALFSNTRSRIIIIFTAAVLLMIIGVGFVKFQSALSPEPVAGADLKRAPGGIQSIPGALNQTAQYAALQEEQNIAQAQQAAKTGASAIPTIIRTQAFGAGVEMVGAQNGNGGIGFTTLGMADDAGMQQSLWIQSLKDSQCSQPVLKKVESEGAGLSTLRSSCSCAQLRQNGFTLNELTSVCSCPELKKADYSAGDLKNIGYTAEKLRHCGYSACEVRGAGFTAEEMSKAGYSNGELKGAGFSDEAIRRANGIPDGISLDDIRRAGCNPDALRRLRSQGVSAAAIEKVSGCSATQLRAAGYTAEELRAAGFTAAQLRQAGFSAAELKAAGFTARDLLNAGFSPKDLADAGYSAKEISDAESTLPPGITDFQLKQAGCSPAAISRAELAGVSPAYLKKEVGCNDAEIRAAGCDLIKLKALQTKGVTAKQIHDLNGCSAVALKATGFNAADLANAGFDAKTIQGLGLQSVGDAAIRAAGCDPTKLIKLRELGVTAKQIHELNGCSAAALRAAGFSAKDLSDAGFTPAELLAAGFTPAELRAAGIIPAGVIASGRTSNCSVASLKAAHEAGVSATTIKETLGCSAAAMKAAGFTAAELRAAGFTAAELKAAGFTAAELKAAGFTAAELRDAGFTAAELKAAGFTAAQLKAAGFSAAELKAAGFSAAELKAAGFTAAELKAAGFSAAELKAAGFTAAELKAAGYTAAELKAAGFTNAQLQAAGYNMDQQVAPDQGTSAALPQNTPALSKNTQQLQATMNRQQAQMANQQYQAQIKQRSGAMLAAAKDSMQGWKKTTNQVLVSTSEKESKDKKSSGGMGIQNSQNMSSSSGQSKSGLGFIKTGDILFAVMDTSVNSDEPGPILATIVSGKLKGSKLIGSFTLPSNSDKIVVSFNTLSMPGADKTISITAYAIDPNTARTALSSLTDHHYMQRYSALFASSFMQGMSSAIQSSNTTVSVGGTGGNTNTTVSTLGRSTLDNALIGLGQVGKAWSTTAQKQMNRPTTVEVFAGTGLGILFTQDTTL